MSKAIIDCFKDYLSYDVSNFLISDFNFIISNDFEKILNRFEELSNIPLYNQIKIKDNNQYDLTKLLALSYVSLLRACKVYADIYDSDIVFWCKNPTNQKRYLENIYEYFATYDKASEKLSCEYIVDILNKKDKYSFVPCCSETKANRIDLSDIWFIKRFNTPFYSYYKKQMEKLNLNYFVSDDVFCEYLQLVVESICVNRKEKIA